MIREFHYRIGWRSGGVHPGAHLGQSRGEGQWFDGWAPFLALPDPRRLDLRATARDPEQRAWVRLYRRRVRLDVHVLLDLSASMGFLGYGNKVEAMADFLAGLASSVGKCGDRLGVQAAAEAPLRAFFLPPSRQIGAAVALARQLRTLQPTGHSAQGLLAAAQRLHPRRSLVFLVSDFHFADGLLHALAGALHGHDWVPVVLWDRAEVPEGYGLLRIKDAESGWESFAWLRPALHRRWQAQREARAEELRELLRRHGREPLFLWDRFSADAVTRHFLQAP